jgi:hypothetical protein
MREIAGSEMRNSGRFLETTATGGGGELPCASPMDHMRNAHCIHTPRVRTLFVTLRHASRQSLHAKFSGTHQHPDYILTSHHRGGYHTYIHRMVAKGRTITTERHRSDRRFCGHDEESRACICLQCCHLQSLCAAHSKFGSSSPTRPQRNRTEARAPRLKNCHTFTFPACSRQQFLNTKQKKPYGIEVKSSGYGTERLTLRPCGKKPLSRHFRRKAGQR